VNVVINFQISSRATCRIWKIFFFSKSFVNFL